MKNLKIFNSDWFKRTVSAGLAVVLAGSLTGCSLTEKKETVEEKTEDNNLQTVVADNRMISLNDLKLKNLKTQKVVEFNNIDAVLIGNKLERKFDIIKVLFDNSVDSILIDDEFISVSNLGLFNAKTNEDVDALDYALVGDELVPIDEYFAEGCSVEKDNKDVNNDDVVEEEYVELTDKKFYELVDTIYNKYSEVGLDVTRDEVIDYVMFANIERIANDNKELIASIIGDRKIENVELNAFDVYSAVMTQNNYNYCSKNLGWDSIILVSDTIFDKKEKEAVISIENRVKEIVAVSGNKDEFNKLLNTLLMEMLNATEEEFNMGYGAGYSTMTIIINFVRRNFTSSLDKANSELIKYFISYAEEYGTSYYDNSRSTAYYSGIYNLLTDTLSCAKTRTK